MEINSSTEKEIMETSSTEKEIIETNNIEEKSDVKTTDNVDIKKMSSPFGQTTMGFAPPMIFKTKELGLTEEEEKEREEFLECVYGISPRRNPVSFQPMMSLEDFKAGKKCNPMFAQLKNPQQFPTTPKLFEIEMSKKIEKKTNTEEDRKKFSDEATIDSVIDKQEEEDRKRLSDGETIENVRNKQEQQIPRIRNACPLSKIYQMRIDRYFAERK